MGRVCRGGMPARGCTDLLRGAPIRRHERPLRLRGGWGGAKGPKCVKDPPPFLAVVKLKPLTPHSAPNPIPRTGWFWDCFPVGEDPDALHMLRQWQRESKARGMTHISAWPHTPTPPPRPKRGPKPAHKRCQAHSSSAPTRRKLAGRAAACVECAAPPSSADLVSYVAIAG